MIYSWQTMTTRTGAPLERCAVKIRFKQRYNMKITKKTSQEVAVSKAQSRTPISRSTYPSTEARERSQVSLHRLIHIKNTTVTLRFPVLSEIAFALFLVRYLTQDLRWGSWPVTAAVIQWLRMRRRVCFVRLFSIGERLGRLMLVGLQISGRLFPPEILSSAKAFPGFWLSRKSGSFQ